MSDTAVRRAELIVGTIARTAVENEKYFCELDAVAGDGDFGYSLARGFEKVLEGWDDIDRTNPGTFLKKVGMIVTSRIGGTSGPIWGTAFLRAGGSLAGKPEPTGADVIEAMRAAIVAAAASAAREAAEATSTMIAKRGRASYTGERSIGSVDAGAMGVAVLAEHISKAWPEAAG